MPTLCARRPSGSWVLGFFVPWYSAINTLIDQTHKNHVVAMKDNVATLRLVMDEEQWGSLREVGRPSWLAEFHKEWEQADAQKDKQAAYIGDKVYAEDDADEPVSPPQHAAKAKKKLNGKEASVDA